MNKKKRRALNAKRRELNPEGRLAWKESRSKAEERRTKIKFKFSLSSLILLFKCSKSFKYLGTYSSGRLSYLKSNSRLFPSEAEWDPLLAPENFITKTFATIRYDMIFHYAAYILHFILYTLDSADEHMTELRAAQRTLCIWETHILLQFSFIRCKFWD